MGPVVITLFNWFFFDDDDSCRMTGIWRWPWRGDEGAEGLRLLATRVTLGSQQDGAVESSVLCSHLEWAFGGFHGVDGDGDPWLVLLQLAPESARALVGSTDPCWVMADGLERSLGFNAEAETWDETRGIGRDRLGLVSEYENAGIDHGRIAEWPTPDLVEGLLAACTLVPLEQVVEGYEVGCCFPDEDHDCQGDVFSDAFAAWSEHVPR